MSVILPPHPRAFSEAALVRIGLLINSITDVDYRHSTFKASVSLTVVLEKSKKPVGASIVPFDQYQYPFSDVLLMSQSSTALDDYRLVTTSNDGTSTSRKRYDAQFVCAFQLSSYPFDKQECAITVLAVRHPAKQLSLSWIDSEGARLGPNVSPPNVAISAISSELCEVDSTYAVSQFNSASARFGCVRAKVTMSRPLYIPLVRFFLPSGLAVLLSWTALYIDRTRLQSRFTVLIFATCVLFIATFCAYSEIPPLIYFTAGDVWVMTCYFFMFLSYIELLVAHVLMNLSRKQWLLATKDTTVRVESRHRNEKSALRRSSLGTPRPPPANGRHFDKKHAEVRFDTIPRTTSTSNSDTIVQNYFRRWSDYYSVTAARLDLLARIVLPSFFILFALLYFIFYVIL